MKQFARLECGLDGEIFFINCVRHEIPVLRMTAENLASYIASKPSCEACDVEVPFTCPKCGAISHNANDKANGYCGRCKEYTGAHVGTSDVTDSEVMRLMQILGRSKKP
jgi:hypothetical protein